MDDKLISFMNVVSFVINTNLTNKLFINIPAPRYARLCNSVSWSHTETNMLAVAMEKHRSDHCILVWDVYRGILPEEARGCYNYLNCY